ncbi:TIGR01440 family protein [Oceanobacillus limi]|uniref:UPF0340 protein SAMN05216389_11928 n=1 Tax=Oceanobacillus limi TaxID=930131 RepID=A0A1I0G5M5_9BACI|nr:TIGR01440 family protein [Oceanobacillus limi]SET66066.1 TIGR01440 family protein [Oceanobacillus limi]
MEDASRQIQQNMNEIVSEWLQSAFLRQGDLVVVGCSTSEVAGQNIGTSGSEEVAAHIFTALQQLAKKTGAHLVFQCCEHLNRALVMERAVMEQFPLTEVTVVPVPSAGGSMASYAYKHLNEPVVVEHVQADAGIDIGETLIGMHLKHVAVPLRLNQRFVGNARVNAARTRPKLIGGERAVYDQTKENNSCT